MHATRTKRETRSVISRATGCRRREGKILVLMAILLPTIIGLIGLVLDVGLMLGKQRDLQHTVDAAATAAATDLRLGKSVSTATGTAAEMIQVANGFPAADVLTHIPPLSGPFAGRTGYVEVTASIEHPIRFLRILDGVTGRTIRTRAVAGVDDVTSGSAIVILDPHPDPIVVDLNLAASFVDAVAFGLVSDDKVFNVTAVNQTLAPLGLGQLLSQVGLGFLLDPVEDSLRASLMDLAGDNILNNLVEDLLNDTLSGLPIAPLPGLTAGLEIEGLGRLRVDGSILVNNEWGGLDENGERVGDNSGLPYGMACMPILPTTRVLARDVRVVGGVDNPNSYQPFVAGEPNPLQANRLPVPDPFLNLPVPTISSDPDNVASEIQNGNRLAILSPSAVPQALHAVQQQVLENALTQILGGLGQVVANLVRPVLTPLLDSAVEDALLNLLGPGETQTLVPGVYDSIQVVSLVGGVRFEPGVYIVRGPEPIVLIGDIQAEGVMFYITDSPSYDGISSVPDANDGEDVPPNYALPTLAPSAVILPTLGARITGLNDPGSPFDGMLIYQRRHDRRLILIAAHHLAAGGEIAGTVYSKWGHTVFAGGLGSYDLRFVSGTMRVLTVFDTTLAPRSLLPPARDVLLVE